MMQYPTIATPRFGGFKQSGWTVKGTVNLSGAEEIEILPCGNKARVKLGDSFSTEYDLTQMVKGADGQERSLAEYIEWKQSQQQV